jgi:hypothetical protein
MSGGGTVGCRERQCGVVLGCLVFVVVIEGPVDPKAFEGTSGCDSELRAARVGSRVRVAGEKVREGGRRDVGSEGRCWRVLISGREQQAEGRSSSEA